MADRLFRTGKTGVHRLAAKPATEYRVVGRGKDPHLLAGHILDGRSVLIVGGFGFGKSFLADAVVDRLRSRGIEPHTLRGVDVEGMTTLDGVAMIGTLEDALSEFGKSQRAGRPVVVSVDDAQTLPPTVMRSLKGLVHAGSVTVLLTSTAVVAGARVAGGDIPESETVRAINELWIEHGAERVDVAPLTEAEAQELLTEAMPGIQLDTVSRALVYANSGGSPRLIKELASAVASLSAGEPRITAFSSLASRSPRILDLLQHQLAVLSEDQLTLLAALHVTGPLPVGVLRSTVSRSDARVLAQHGFILPNYRATQTLVPRALFAGAADEIADPDRVHRVTDAFAVRILRDRDHFPSPAQAIAIANQWGLDEEPDAVEQWGAERVAAVFLAAASACNAIDNFARAEGFARRSGRLRPSILAEVELSRSLAYRGRLRRAFDVLADANLSTVAIADLSRAVGWWAELATAMPDAVEALNEVSRRVQGVVDERQETACLVDRVNVVTAEVTGDLPRVIALGERLLGDVRADIATRIAAGNSAAIGLSQTGHGRRALDFIDVLDGLVGDMDSSAVAFGSPDFGARVCATDAGVRCVGGFEVGQVSERMSELFEHVDAFDNREVLANISMMAALVALHEGQLEKSEVELRSADRWLDRIDVADWRAWLQFQSGFVAARRGNDALAQVESNTGAPLECGSAAAPVFGATDEMGALVVGWEAFEIFLLFSRSGDVVKRLEAAAELTDSPLLQAKAVYARAVVRDDANALDASSRRFAELDATGLSVDASRRAARLHAERGDTHAAEASRVRARKQGLRAVQSQRRPIADEVPPNRPLTRREAEVARLAASGLSDREMAQALFLSVRTVESHLYQARMKLGVDSRHGLGAMLEAATA